MPFVCPEGAAYVQHVVFTLSPEVDPRDFQHIWRVGLVRVSVNDSQVTAFNFSDAELETRPAGVRCEFAVRLAVAGGDRVELGLEFPGEPFTVQGPAGFSISAEISVVGPLFDVPIPAESARWVN